jgi:nucleoside-diphosphate-sugar epimerase
VGSERYRLLPGYDNFFDLEYDLVINCIGVGTLRRHRGDFRCYFTVPERFDNLVIEYLKRKPETIYVSLGSGAIYGRDFSVPAALETRFSVPVNQILPHDYYSISRLYAEAKHRAYSELRICDLRVFSYFSRFQPLDDGYFISDLLRAVIRKQVFRTSPFDFVRDYLHPDDLFAAILQCRNRVFSPVAVDITSREPISKQEILDFFHINYGLRYELAKNAENKSATGEKSFYFSLNHPPAEFSYHPVFSSLETVRSESAKLLRRFGIFTKSGRA